MMLSFLAFFLALQSCPTFVISQSSPTPSSTPQDTPVPTFQATPTPTPKVNTPAPGVPGGSPLVSYVYVTQEPPAVSSGQVAAAVICSIIGIGLLWGGYMYYQHYQVEQEYGPVDNIPYKEMSDVPPSTGAAAHGGH
eukprot:PhF_6_TR17155/c0_g1_i1/m.26420